MTRERQPDKQERERGRQDLAKSPEPHGIDPKLWRKGEP